MNSFPKVILAALIVSAGIYLADQYDTRAAWLIAFLVLLTVAFGYPKFGDELIQLVGGKGINQQTVPATPPNTVLPGVTGPIPGTFA